MCKIKNVLKYPLTFCVLITLYFPLFATHVVVDIFLSPLSILKSSHPLHAHLAAGRHPLFLYYFSYYYSPHFLICAHSHFNQCTLSELNLTAPIFLCLFSSFFTTNHHLPLPYQYTHTLPIESHHSHIFMFVFFFFHHQPRLASTVLTKSFTLMRF